jgi:hypothetical protein
MGANRPSIEALRLDQRWGNSHHTQSCRKGKKGSVENERENTHDRDCGRELGGTLEIQGVMNRGGGE